MSHEMIRRLRGVALFTTLALIATTAGAQTARELHKAASARLTVARNQAIRVIALDPCNTKPRIPSLVEQLRAPADEAQASLENYPEMFGHMADQGCENANKQLPELELYLTAMKFLYLDACAYAPDKDYSAELAMARMSYGDAESFAFHMRDVLERPCAADFIVAKLTGKPLVRSTPAIEAAPAAPAPPAPAQGGARRRSPG